MPIYEFVCVKCDIQWERYTSQSTDICPKCSRLTKKTFSAPAIIIDGAGSATLTKPGSYWDNSEKCHQADLKKRADEAKEKAVYGDKSVSHTNKQ